MEKDLDKGKRRWINARRGQKDAPGRLGTTRQSCRRRETLDFSARSCSPDSRALAARLTRANAPKQIVDTWAGGLQRLEVCAGVLQVVLRQSQSLCFPPNSCRVGSVETRGPRGKRENGTIVERQAEMGATIPASGSLRKTRFDVSIS